MDYADINLDKIDVIDKKPYQNYKQLEFWTPPMYIPFGLDHYDNKYGDKYELKLSFKDEEGQFLKKFKNKMVALDAYFKRIHPGTEYHSFLKNEQNLVVKIPKMKGNFQCSVASEFEELPTVFSLKKGCWVKCLIKFDKIWNYQKKSGCIIVAKELVITKMPPDIENEETTECLFD